MKIDENLIETSIQAPLGSKLLESDAIIIQRENWYQVVTPSVKEASVNEVIISRVLDSEAQAVVDETFDIYQRHQVPFKWCIGPMSNTRAIEPKIQTRASDSWLYRGMVAESKMEVSHPAEIKIDQVTESNFEQFLDVFLAGWKLEKLPHSAKSTLKKISKSDSTFPYFLASIAGAPVGAAGSVIKDNSGYLVGAVVLEKFRGSGAYRALLQGRLKDLVKRGKPYAVTHAREATSAPILEKLGFQTTFRAKIYKFD